MMPCAMRRGRGLQMTPRVRTQLPQVQMRLRGPHLLIHAEASLSLSLDALAPATLILPLRQNRKVPLDMPEMVPPSTRCTLIAMVTEGGKKRPRGFSL